MSAAVLQFVPRERATAPAAPAGEVVAFPFNPKPRPECFRACLRDAETGEPISDKEGARWLIKQPWAWKSFDKKSKNFLLTISISLEEKPLSWLQAKWLSDLIEASAKGREASNATPSA